jgi:dihydrofolate synthase / folylpolyglutamate synthase
VASQEPPVEQVLAEQAVAQSARTVREGSDIMVVERTPAVGGQMITLRGVGGTYTDIFLPLFGEHQSGNALLALVATEMLVTGGAALDPGVVEVAFADVTSPGRLEVVRSSPLVIVDGAHNPAGARAEVAAIEEAFALTRVVGVVGMMADKDVEGILGELEPLLDEIVVTWAGGDRAMDPDDLAEAAREVFGEDRVHVEPRLDDAIDVAVQRAEGEVDRGSAVLVTGSIMLVAQARVLLGR